MIYSNFTGRVAKTAKVIDGVNGQFLSMDLAVNDFSKGEEVTQWVRVQTSDPSHIKLVQYFTKGKILTIHGNIKIDQWEGRDGTPRAQLRVHAKFIDFLNIGKKPVTDNNVPSFFILIAHHRATFPTLPRSSVAVAIPRALKTLLIVGMVML